MESGVLVRVKGASPGGPSHAFSGHGETVGVVDEAVEDCVGEGRIANDVTPLLGRNLTGDEGRSAAVAVDEGRSAAVAVLEDFEQIDALALGEDRQAPVIENQKVNPGEGFEHAGVTAIAARERQGLE